ncbi:hypothetical protein EP1X_07015 [Thermococcus sp. EP1]|uniref:sulfite exporter TauE/SafE family protein n=1 Tax=Thermococcus sp. EP1 TaxID=1591054 RepID=UPI0006DAC018|nr:sulfite exporter TauE/SafE family protein [Thermococcus sp. EP1]KPU62797.1 hypothetical protein EP1X_07015 [Thermococcus sp. EP1]
MEGIAFLLLALFGGFVGSLMSGGSLITLFILTLLEVPTKMAVGTLKMVIAILTLVSSIIYLKNGVLKNMRPVYILTFSSILGSYLGSFFLLAIPEKPAKIVVAGFLLIGAYFTLSGEEEKAPRLKGNLWQAVVGLTIGFYIGVLGIASTLILISAIHLFLSLDMLEANAVAKIIIFTNNFIAFLNYASQDSVNYSFGILLAFPIIIGSWIGAKTAIKIGPKKLKVVFFITVLLTVFKILEELLSF